VAALHLWVGVGGRDEGPGERGFSHFVEHMLFKGTATRAQGFVDREVEGLGGRTNAGTSWDYTFYYVLLPAARATHAVELLADMAFNSRFDPAEIDRERDVIFEEVRLGQDDARRFLGRRLYELAFGDHPYGRPVLGDEAAMRAANRERLLAYYKRHYVPENMTLVVIGAVTPAEIRRAVARSFGAVPAGGRVRQPLPPPARLDGSQREVRPRPERQASLALGWAAPRLGDGDMFAVDLLAHILGGTRTSRLGQALRERDRLVTSVRASYSALQGGGLLSVSAQLEAADIEKAEAALHAEVKRLQDEGVSEAERRRALTAAESQHAFSTETAEGRAYAYGLAETLWTLDGELRYLEGLRAVTREQIQAAARRYLGPPPARLALVPDQARR
jgi:zinc protease